VTLIPSSQLRLHMKLDTNWVPLSLITSLGTVEFPDVIPEQPSYSRGCDIGHCQYDMGVLQQLVYYYHDGIISMALR